MLIIQSFRKEVLIGIYLLFAIGMQTRVQAAS